MYCNRRTALRNEAYLVGCSAAKRALAVRGRKSRLLAGAVRAQFLAVSLRFVLITWARGRRRARAGGHGEGFLVEAGVGKVRADLWMGAAGSAICIITWEVLPRRTRIHHYYC